MEVAGVVYAILSPPIDGFFIVDKENKEQRQRRIQESPPAAATFGGDDMETPLLSNVV